jgi:hypothetical protein
MDLDYFKDHPPCIELPEEEWRDLEATLGVTEPNPAIRRDIAGHVRRHLFWAELDFPKQRINTQRKWITRIRRKTQDLINVLDWEASEDQSDDGWAQMYAVYDLLTSRSEQKDLLASLKELRTKADTMLARLPKGKPGKDADEFLWGLVFDLAWFYEWTTEQRPTITYNDYGAPGIGYGDDGNVGIYESPFLDFVAAVLRFFAPDRAKGNIALGKHVERVLKVWRRHRGFKDKTRASNP